MSTQRQLIEDIQDRLGAAGSPNDIESRYPYEIVKAMVARVYSDSASLDPEGMQDMALEYPLTVSNEGGYYYSNLQVNPIGSWGLLWVSGNGIYIPTDQGGMENKIFATVEPGRIPGCRLVGGNKIVFDSKPEDPVMALMIPDFASLEEDDIVIMKGNEVKIYQMVVQLIRFTDTNRPQEVYNDGVDDFLKAQRKREFIERQR